MLRYTTSALALKFFSSCTATKQLYRALGNKFGGRSRINSKIPVFYFERVNRFLRLNRKYNFIKNGDRLIEIGTGWVHWEAVTTRLFFDIKAVLFDVWDNRQLGGLLNYINQFSDMLGNSEANNEQQNRARLLINMIQKVNSFEELYEALGFEYVVDQQGDLSKFKNGSFDVIVSAGVLEHIRSSELVRLVRSFHRILKPGGYSMHSINLSDHLFQYDRKVSLKQYLSFSNSMWKRWFENEVQYINRLQRTQWLDIFRQANFELVDEEQASTDLTGLKINNDYKHLNQNDLECINVKFLHHKRLAL